MSIPPSSSVLERNLAALQGSNPRVAGLVRGVCGRTDMEFAPTEQGCVSVVAGGRQLCSRRRPLEEAKKLAETVDVGAAAVVVCLGFGAGHHVRAMLERMARTGVVVVFEPDAALLRAVLEHADHSAWLGSRNLLIVTEAAEAAIADATRGCEALVTMGVRFIEHPADRTRLGEASRAFERVFASTLRAVRNQIVTALMQPGVTMRNALMNLDWYVSVPGIADLKGAAAGKPAIVVAAGPSLRRNVGLLARAGVRDRFVIIAVQTALKTLLARGVRPHFVTALDYHQISARFYEGLTPADTEGVTLVAMPWANPVILESFPGAKRIPEDWMPDWEQQGAASRRRQSLDDLIGADGRGRGRLTPGATVAHMAHYLARHLGCDPVILIGQDLGFTDGQYYAAGAAIHDVWACELNPFNSLEAMEWQRIVRGRAHLHRATDALGRPVYTDEQMATYRVQFERDFAADGERGLRVIDATEGGVAKRGAETMTLAEAIAAFGGGGSVQLPAPRVSRPDPEAMSRLRERVGQVRRDVRHVEDLARQTGAALEEMKRHHADQPRVNALIAKVQAAQEEVLAIQPAFSLVQRINQTGQLKRAMADRRIALEHDLAPLEKQKRQIERDIVNVEWLAAAAGELGRTLERTLECLDGAPKLMEDPAEEREPEACGVETGEAAGAGGRRGRVIALVAVDPVRGGLGTQRDLAQAVHEGRNALELMLARLARSEEVRTVVLLGEDPARIRKLAGEATETGGADGLRVEVEATEGPPLGERGAAMRGARLWSRSCWRGGLFGMTVYDEALAPGAMLRAMEARDADAAVVVGADWACVDPLLVDEAVRRYRLRPEGPGAHRLTFVQAPPGLGACIIERGLMRELAEKQAEAGVFATLGGLLGYAPIAPLADPIAKPVCVAVPAPVRDAQFRFIPDSGPRRAAVSRVMAMLGDGALWAGAKEIAAALTERQRWAFANSPQELVLELCTGRRTSGLRALWSGGEAAERAVMPLESAAKLVREFASLREDAALTLAGAGDPLLCGNVFKLIRLAKDAGIGGVHIRTDLLCEAEVVDELLGCGVDIISVDLMAETPATYRKVMGVDLFARARGNLERLIEGRSRLACSGGLPRPWIVPRITRCDAVYGEIEPFYDRWLMGAGAAAIDAMPVAIPGERIEPLPLPSSAVGRLARERMVVLSDGRVPPAESDIHGERTVADALRIGLAAAWRDLCSWRAGTAPIEPKTGPLVHGGGGAGGGGRSRVARLEMEP